jgi:uncharacterized membrane protein
MRIGGREIEVNAGDVEHVGAMVVGGLLFAVGASRPRSPAGWLLGAAGGALVARGVYGYKRLYDALGVQLPPEPTRLSLRALKIEKSINIARRPEELYAFWRKLENLPLFMEHIVSVEEQDEKTSHWKAKAPVGMVVEWDAEIIHDVPNQLIAWRSLEGSDVDHAGSVHFDESADGQGTELWMTIRYTPPGDVVGAQVARLFGQDPEQEINSDLKRFKEMMEKQSSGHPVVGSL